MQIDIVSLRPPFKDVTDLVRLVKHVYVGEGHTPSDVAEKVFTSEHFSQSDFIIVAKAAEENIGMIAGARFGNKISQLAVADELEVQNFAVDSNYRNLGLGVKLCQTLEGNAMALGYRKLVLATLPSMAAAHKLYEKIGYQRNPNRDVIKNNRIFLVYEKSLL